MQLKSEDIAQNIDKWAAVQKTILNEALETILVTDNFEADYLKKVMARVHRDNPQNEYYIGLADKQFYTGTGSDGGPGFDPTSREWYIKSKEKGEIHITSPYIDAITGGMVITISKDFTSHPIGAVGTDIPIDYMVDLVSESDYGDGSYAFLMDHMGNIVTHLNQDYLASPEEGFKNIGDVLDGKIADLMGESSLNLGDRKIIDYDGEEKFMFFADVGEMDWKIGVAVPVDVVMGSINQVIMFTVIAALGVLFISMMMSLYVSSNVTRPITDAVQAAEDISNLDLSMNMDEGKLNRKDEMGLMYRAFDNTIVKLRSFMSDMEGDLQ